MRVTEASQGLLLDLSRAFSGHLVGFPHLLKRSLLSVFQSETQREDTALPFGESRQGVRKLLVQMGMKDCSFRIRIWRGNEVRQRTIPILTYRPV